MLSDAISHTTLKTTHTIGKAFTNSLRGAVMFGALAGGAVLLASTIAWVGGISLLGMGAGAIFGLLVPVTLDVAVAGAALQFVTSFIPWGSKHTAHASAPSPDTSPRIDAPSLSRAPQQSLENMPDINPDARTGHVEALNNRAVATAQFAAR